jgi:hypothetical protein
MAVETTKNDRHWSLTRVVAATLAAALPLVGLTSLLLRSELDLHIENYRAHFIVFGIVGGVAFVLGYAAGEAATRRGDARVRSSATPSTPVRDSRVLLRWEES